MFSKIKDSLKVEGDQSVGIDEILSNPKISIEDLSKSKERT
jgi:hypothetical protein